MERNEIINLIRIALDAKQYAYAPYSKFKVGAALLASNGFVFTGCNIENAAYSPTVCAERVALFKAVSQGIVDFKAIAVTGGDNNIKGSFTPPCGVCRQVLAEFVDNDNFLIIIANSEKDFQILSISEMLPMPFGGKKPVKK